MWKVESPNREFDGRVGSMAFGRGVATTLVQHEAEWAARHGYRVTPLVEGLADVKPPTIAETGTAGEEAFYGHRAVPSEDASISIGMTDEQRRETYGERVGQLLGPAQSPTGAPEIAPSDPGITFASEEDAAAFAAIIGRARAAGEPAIENRAIVNTSRGTDPGGVIAYRIPDPKAANTESPAEREAKGGGRSSSTTRKSTGRKSTGRGRKSTGAKARKSTAAKDNGGSGSSGSGDAE